MTVLGRLQMGLKSYACEGCSHGSTASEHQIIDAATRSSKPNNWQILQDLGKKEHDKVNAMMHARS